MAEALNLLENDENNIFSHFMKSGHVMYVLHKIFLSMCLVSTSRVLFEHS